MKKILLLLVSFAAISCSDWFDIEPPTQVKEEQLFSKDKGFYHALMGVYIGATESGLYGRTLSYDFIDVLANVYKIDDSGDNKYIQDYNYTEAGVESKVNAIWSREYTLIAYCNNILKNLPGKEALFPAGNYEVVEAEARALRAFFHFDLLRLFAPAPVVGLEQKAIPYVDAVSTVPFPQLSVGEVLEKILADMQRAATLLENFGDIFNDAYVSEDAFLGYLADNGFTKGNIYRMNKGVVNGLLARIYLYKGDYEQAYKFARKLYSELGNPTDYNWKNDIISGFWIDKKVNGESSKACFSKDAQTGKLDITENARKEVFEVSRYQSIDVRYLRNFSSQTGETEIFLNKYFDCSYCYPIMKSSEVFLILAETAEENGDDGFTYLNELRAARGLSAFPLNKETSDLKEEIAREYQKEFIGEGQLFYYYKRKNLAGYEGNNLRQVKSLNYHSYVLPIPEDEKTFGKIE